MKWLFGRSPMPCYAIAIQSSIPMGNTNQPARNDACGNGFRNVHFGRKRNSESRTGRESLDCWMTIFRVTEVGAEKASLVSFLYRMSHQKPMIDNSESQIPRIVSPQRAVKTRLAAAVANDERRRLPFFPSGHTGFKPSSRVRPGGHGSHELQASCVGLGDGGRFWQEAG